MNFDTPEQRMQADLIWAATSPDMMQLESLTTTSGLHSFNTSSIADELSNWLTNNNLSTDLQALIAHREPRRLGIYYEMLWQTIFEHYPNFQLVAQNLVITKEARTLGEMDFIYFCQQRQRHVHLETAVKF